MNRILSIVRLQVVGRRGGLVWPVMILSISFIANLVIFGAAGDAIEQPVTGGLASIYIATLVFGAVAINQQFPFALGMSVTRREFAAGLGLFVLAQALIYAVLLVILQAVENATDGWGTRMQFFGLGMIDDYGVLARLLIYAAPMLLMSLIGITFGAVYARWQVNGVFATVAALGLLTAGVSSLITYGHGWPAIGRWLLHQTPITLFALVPLALVAVLCLASWTTLRRATA